MRNPDSILQPSSSLTASVVRRAAGSSPSVPCAVQGHVALDLRHRRAHMREQELRGVVLEGLATPQEDAKYDQGVARLVRAQVHGCFWERGGQCEEDVGPARSSLMLGELYVRPVVLYSRPASRFGSYSGAPLLRGSDWSPRMYARKITPPTAFILES